MEELIENPDNDPTIEEIVGAENVIDLHAEDENDPPSDPPGGMICSQCTFTSHLLSELEEHCAGTGHGGMAPIPPAEPVTPVQPELFRGPTVIDRWVNAPLPTELLNEKRTTLADLYADALEVKSKKKAADSKFNAQLSQIDEEMQGIAAVLANPTTSTLVSCEWRIIEGENARGLYRRDTGDLVEKQALTAEDRAEELEKAQEANASTDESLPESPEPGTDESAEESSVVDEPSITQDDNDASFINGRSKGRKKRKATSTPPQVAQEDPVEEVAAEAVPVEF